MAPTRIDNRKDILLLMLYSPGKRDAVNEAVSGRTRLVKMLFLFKKEALDHFRRGTDITAENFYDFFPWDFGPFSVQVYDDLTFFVLRGFIETSIADEQTLPESVDEWNKWVSSSGAQYEEEALAEYREEEFRLTDPTGTQFAASLYEGLSGQQRALLREFKARTSSAPLRALLRYVYQKHTEMTAKSRIKEQVLGSG